MKERKTTCSTSNANPSSGAAASSPWKPGAWPGKPTARSWPPTARPRCWLPWSFEKAPRPGLDFFPLTVNYQEKTFAAGKIPGGFFKREGDLREGDPGLPPDRPADPAAVRQGFKHETQVIITVLSHDLENDPDIVAMVAASAALTLSGVPFMGPIGAARVGFIDGEYVLNPTLDQVADRPIASIWWSPAPTMR